MIQSAIFRVRLDRSIKCSSPWRQRARVLAASSVLTLACAAGHAQTWTRLLHDPPGAINLMLLLSDGTVLAFENSGDPEGNSCYRLIPDIHGSYANGTWSTLAPMLDTRLYYSSQVLRDGRVFVAGGEYGAGKAHAEVFDPVANTWTAISPPVTLLDPTQPSPVNGSPQAFLDANSEILANGNVLIAPVLPKVSGQPLIYNPVTNTWSAGPPYVRGVSQDEASWVKLPDSSILTIDPSGTHSERYIPSLNMWVDDGVVPVSLYDPFGFELGAAALLPNGKALFLGSTGHTALYAPSGTSAAGSWTAGPDFPGAHGTPDAPCAVLVTGRVLCAVSPVPTSGSHYPSPTTFYEYDPAPSPNGAFTSVGTPAGALQDFPPFVAAMLDLPDGTVMYSHMDTEVYIYTPAGTPLAAGKPTVIGVTPNGDGTYHLSGTGLNGISEGASYGDDMQMNTNYPLVRLTEAGGNVYYARTFNWSSTGVMTGSQVLSVDYRPPAGLPSGTYSYVVVANGFASDPFTFNCTPPTISANPAPQQTVCPGASVLLTVAASGTATLTYQWRRGTTVLSNIGNASGANTATLTLSPVGPLDTGNDYNCLVSNGCGSAPSGFAAITVSPGGYANCDASTNAPVLNVADFTCFLQKYSNGNPYANCDASTSPPILNVADFTCFLQRYSSGCL